MFGGTETKLIPTDIRNSIYVKTNRVKSNMAPHVLLAAQLEFFTAAVRSVLPPVVVDGCRTFRLIIMFDYYLMPVFMVRSIPDMTLLIEFKTYSTFGNILHMKTHSDTGTHDQVAS